MPRINTTAGEHYRGMGDMVSLAWIAEGSRGSSDPVNFYANRQGNYGLLKLLGQDVSDDPADQGVLVGDAYLNELREGGTRLRLDYIRELLGIDTPHLRPRVHLSQDAVTWALETKKQHGEQLVLIFPQTLWESRTWPSCYWVELSWRLKQQGVPVIVALRDEDKRYKNTPNYLWGFDLGKVAALMSVAALVIGNDSGPAHLAGTIGTPTLALCGPTRGECVFGHIPEVTVITSEDESPGCSGCHFKPPFRAACDEGCQALYSLKPDVVIDRTLSSLRGEEPPAIASRLGLRQRLGLRFPLLQRRQVAANGASA